ncbi:MAG TPA: ABC transporter permease [Vicinamibacteria bacterium]|nr:ABC transporter permease [Vicinamibacteria bacterium]
MAVAATTFREAVRERVLYNLVFFAILMTLSGLMMRELSIRQDEKIVKDIGLAAMELVGTVIAVFVGMGLVSKEIERRSLHPVLAKPVSRDEFLLGKFGGLAFTLLVNTAVMTAGLYLTLLATGRRAEMRLLVAVGTIYVGLLLVVALSLLFSAVTSTTVAALCTVALVVAGRFADVIRGMREVAPAAPEWLVRVLYYALPNFRTLDYKNPVVYGDPIDPATLGLSVLYGAAYIVVALGIAMAAFRSRDFQ